MKAEEFDIRQLEAKVQTVMSAMDCSHDWEHVQRVRRLARHLALNEEADLFIVDLAALLHDVNDHKYDQGKMDVGALLQGIEPRIIDHVCHVVDNVSFSKQHAQDVSHEVNLTTELMCVRDADRLDALGAVGIARCAAFSAVKHRPMYIAEDPAHPGNRDNSTMLGHFHAKLFKLPDIMHTETARQMAHERVLIMRQFISCLQDEAFHL
jgi:uncharacterized protein